MRKPFRLEQEGVCLHLMVQTTTGTRCIDRFVAFCDQARWWFSDEGCRVTVRALAHANLLSIARDVEGNPRKDLGLKKAANSKGE